MILRNVLSQFFIVKCFSKSLLIYSLPWNMRLHCFFTVNNSVNAPVNAAGDHLAGRSFMEKEKNERLFLMITVLASVV